MQEEARRRGGQAARRASAALNNAAQAALPALVATSAEVSLRKGKRRRHAQFKKHLLTNTSEYPAVFFSSSGSIEIAQKFQTRKKVPTF